jgi:hypothetical protein
MAAPFRIAELGASNALTNARVLARVASIVSLGGTVDRKLYGAYLGPGPGLVCEIAIGPRGGGIVAGDCALVSVHRPALVCGVS